MDTSAEPAESYRAAELRLRSLLLGNGTETVGLAHRDDERTRVIVNLRRMRDAFAALAAEHEVAGQIEEAEARIAQLEDDLLRIAADRARERSPDALLSAAEAAGELRMSRSTFYRAVRRGEIAAIRNAGEPMRIPASEIRRLVAEPASA